MSPACTGLCRLKSLTAMVKCTTFLPLFGFFCNSLYNYPVRDSFSAFSRETASVSRESHKSMCVLLGLKMALASSSTARGGGDGER